MSLKNQILFFLAYRKKAIYNSIQILLFLKRAITINDTHHMDACQGPRAVCGIVVPSRHMTSK